MTAVELELPRGCGYTCGFRILTVTLKCYCLQQLNWYKFALIIQQSFMPHKLPSRLTDEIKGGLKSVFCAHICTEMQSCTPILLRPTLS